MVQLAFFPNNSLADRMEEGLLARLRSSVFGNSPKGIFSSKTPWWNYQWRRRRRRRRVQRTAVKCVVTLLLARLIFFARRVPSDFVGRPVARVAALRFGLVPGILIPVAGNPRRETTAGAFARDSAARDAMVPSAR